MALGAYTDLAFPVFPPQFGGGRKRVVQIVLKQSAPPALTERGLPLSADSKTVGPVLLLADSGGLVILQEMATTSEPNWSPRTWSRFARPMRAAVALNRADVEMVLYTSDSEHKK
jgi:hypothetical protein